MSWLFGIIFHSPRNAGEFDPDFLPAADYEHVTQNLLIRAGGIEETCLFDNSTNGWCVCGSGIQNTGLSFLTRDEWNKSIRNNLFLDNPPDGHYAIFRWSGETVEGFTDPLGIREIYIAERNDGIVFSTSLEWVSRHTGESSIDPAVFGSRWLLVNQVSTDSIIKNITRLSRGQSFKIVNNYLSIDNPLTFTLPHEKAPTGEIKRSLSAITVFPLEHDEKLSLSLSGGFDSRVLFAILINQNDNRWDAHTFGDRNHPDAVIAKTMCDDFRIPHVVHTPSYTTIDELVCEGKKIAASTSAIFAASSVLQLHHYHKLATEHKTVIDGGFGEIWRRGFMNRIFYKGAGALRKGDYETIAELLKFPRADIFNDDFTGLMERGCIEQLDSLFTQLHKQTTSLDVLLDLFMIHTRIPNIYGPEQARVDGYVRNYMPFIQHRLIGMILQTDNSKRKNGILMKEIIDEYAPSVKKYPLVKGTTTYPYWQPTLLSRAWTKLKEKTGYTYRERQQFEFLDFMKPYVLDTIESEEVRNSDLYSPDKISLSARRYYNGEKQFAPSLDWWLAFEWMLQSLRGLD